MPQMEVMPMDDPLEISDAEFMRWAGTHSQRWAVLPNEKREAWLAHLVARVRTTSDPEQRNAYWRLAHVIVRAGEPASRARNAG
jgi:hypothetical protein